MKETILIIEDEEDILALLSSLLENEGYKIITACNGREGLEKFQEHNPDLIECMFGVMVNLYNNLRNVRQWGCPHYRILLAAICGPVLLRSICFAPIFAVAVITGTADLR